jgi:large subunit ribosomal protein L25
MELQVQKREKLGRSAKALRAQGLIPAELYGKGLENLHLSVPLKEFKKVFRQAGENTIVDILIDGKKHPILINDISYSPLTGGIQSVDFYQVRMDEKIKVGIPLEFVGIAPAIKEKSGILVKALQEVEVEALPADIPRDFKVDLSKLLDIGQSIYVKDLEIYPDVKILVDPETVVVTITAQITEEEELAAQQAATAGIEEIKVETEEKKEEREAAKAAVEKIAPVAETPKETPKK